MVRLSIAGAVLLSTLDAAGLVTIRQSMPHPLEALRVSLVVFIQVYAVYLLAFWLVRLQRAFIVERLQTILEASDRQHG